MRRSQLFVNVRSGHVSEHEGTDDHNHCRAIEHGPEDTQTRTSEETTATTFREGGRRLKRRPSKQERNAARANPVSRTASFVGEQANWEESTHTGREDDVAAAAAGRKPSERGCCGRGRARARNRCRFPFLFSPSLQLRTPLFQRQGHVTGGAPAAAASSVESSRKPKELDPPSNFCSCTAVRFLSALFRLRGMRYGWAASQKDKTRRFLKMAADDRFATSLRKRPERNERRAWINSDPR